MVLDVSSYLNYHPGGRFLIENNIGRDISKFFYGGYSLEATNKSDLHVHTRYAKKVVNSLVVGKLENDLNPFVATI